MCIAYYYLYIVCRMESLNSRFLQENGKWQEKDGKLIAMTDGVDYDIEGLLI